MKISRKLLFALCIGLVLLTLLPGCSSSSSVGEEEHLAMASMDMMPAEVRAALAVRGGLLCPVPS